MKREIRRENGGAFTEKRVLVFGEEDYNALLLVAEKSPRKRAIKNLHEPWEHVSRMFNAIFSESYVRPHKHENPHSSDTMMAVKGVFTVLIFNDEGGIVNTINIYGERVIDIPPNTWHSVIAKVPCVLYETKGHGVGGYNPETDKVFPQWAPEEGTEESERYLEYLKQEIYESEK